MNFCSRLILFIFVALSYQSLLAQGVMVKCAKPIHLDFTRYFPNEKILHFDEGDEVMLMGITDDNGYEFAIYNDTCAASFIMKDNPFVTPIKALKKALPKVDKSGFSAKKVEIYERLNRIAEEHQRYLDEQVANKKRVLRTKALNEELIFPNVEATRWHKKGTDLHVLGFSGNLLYVYDEEHSARVESKVMQLPDSVLSYLPDIETDQEVRKKVREIESALIKKIDERIANNKKKKEEELLLAEINATSRMDSLNKHGEYITITSSYVSLDTKGRVSPSISIRNNTNKEIKYIYFTVKFKNAVNDFVDNQLMQSTRGQFSEKLELTGPIPAHTESMASWRL